MQCHRIELRGGPLESNNDKVQILAAAYMPFTASTNETIVGGRSGSEE